MLEWLRNHRAQNVYFLGRAYICVFDKQWMADGVIGHHGQNALLSVADPDNSGTGRVPPLLHVLRVLETI